MTVPARRYCRKFSNHELELIYWGLGERMDRLYDLTQHPDTPPGKRVYHELELEALTKLSHRIETMRNR